MNEMTRSMKLLLGAATIWPVIYMFLFVAFVFGMIFLSNPGGDPNPDLGPIFGFGFLFIMVIHFLTIFLMFGLTVYYIIHVIKNERMKSDTKAVWAVLFFFMGVLAQPVYWYLHIWKAPQLESSPGFLNSADASTWDFAQGDFRQREYQPPSEPPDWR